MKVYMEFTVEEFHRLQDLVFSHEGMYTDKDTENSLALKFGFAGDYVAAEHIRSRGVGASPIRDVIFTDRMLEALR
jgi:hypothetical protein